MLLQHPFFVASEIDYGDVADVFYFCGEVEERQGVSAYRCVIEIFNWRLHKKYFHRRQYSRKIGHKTTEKTGCRIKSGMTTFGMFMCRRDGNVPRKNREKGFYEKVH
jgi:hypothetical protein